MPTTPTLTAELKKRLNELDDEAKAIKTLLWGSRSTVTARKRAGGRKWTAKNRKEAAARMKAYWAAKKK